MLTPQDVNKWYIRPQPVLDYIESLTKGKARVLEVGPGRTPYANANYFIDCHFSDEMLAMKDKYTLIDIDVERDRIPYDDDYFDFVIASHIVEDLHYPFHLLDEMRRVSKAGYITTPSPIAELSRGVQEAGGQGMPWRGYMHHKWFVGVMDGELVLRNKDCVLEHLTVGNEEAMETLIRDNPIIANTYFVWDKTFSYRKIHQSGQFSEMTGAMLQLVVSSINSTSDFVTMASSIKA